MRRYSCVTVAALLAAALLLPAAARAQKVGYVDLTKALDLTEMGKRIKRDLSAKQDSLELAVKQQELKVLNLKDDYNKKKAGLSREALLQKEQGLEQAMMEGQELLQKSNFEFEQYKAKLVKEFIDKLEQIAGQFAKGEGYSMIILRAEDTLTGSSVILYGAPEADLTNKVIQKLNASGAK